ncbi:helix-turn-helix domain-containing protein [Cytobacillus praedii]|uniref:helix-turn-helix domain-containing protein n=1 Tax=Cytobacillus praedii TaxID=1742358 RepID=UPI003F805CD4
MRKLGELLKELRGNESLREASKRIGISHTYLDTIEKGTDKRSGAPVKPTPDTLKLISKAYNFDYEELMKAAGYIEEDKSDGSNIVREKTAEELYDDPEFQLAMRSAQGFSEENKKKVLDFIEMIEELEKGRKPGDKQPRPRRY